MVFVGAESGDDFIRHTIMKRNMEIPYMLKKLKVLKKYGIKLLTENIIGSPGETFEMALKTLELNIKIKPAYGNYSILSLTQNYPLQIMLSNMDTLMETLIRSNKKSIRFVSPERKLCN
jgi:radical SAM superfamily enzyme YgiQ (UPF0313 family)